MNEYQLRISNKNHEVLLTSEFGNGSAELYNDKLVLAQNENYEIKKYAIQFMNLGFEKVEFKIDATWVNSDLIDF